MTSQDILDRVDIRQMRPDEFDTMRALSVDAFDGDPQIGPLLDALRRSWAWDDDLSFVAEVDGELVGQVLYTHTFVDAPSRLVEVLLLSPVGVIPGHQGVGIGSKMIRETLDKLAGRDEPLVFLEGSPHYYPRFGFERAVELGFTRPSVRIPEAAFMVHRLPRYEQWMKGALVYPDPFWVTDSVGLRDPAASES